MQNGNQITRSIVSTFYTGVKSDGSDVVSCEGVIRGAYTDKQLQTVLNRIDPGYTHDGVKVDRLKVVKYKMSLDTFVKYADAIEE